MRHILAVFVVALLCVPGIAHNVPDTGVRKGMTAREVRDRLGQPRRIVRQVLYRRHIEQWVYENPQQIRVQISCVLGEEPVVTGVIPARTGLPGGNG